ncbi:kinase-like domain-containing protein, partial [Thelephora terrestris]
KGAIVWKHLDHPNIVPFKGVTLDPPQLVSEWMPGGELREYIKKNPSTNLINLLLGVAGGLAYLHSHDIIHGDLKGSNIFVDGSGNARITDFAASSSDEYGFTPRWTAPEIFRGEATANKKSDIFSFGMVAFEAFSGTVPFPEIRSPAVPVAIMKGNRPNRPVHPGLTEPLWRLVQECWKDTAGDRPEIADVIKELKRTSVYSLVFETNALLTLFRNVREQAGYIGGFGTVWKGKHNGSAVAIKRLNVAHLTKSKKVCRLIEIFCHEVIMWKRLSHPNTLPFIGACIRGSELVVVSEWIENGNIREYLRRNTQADRLSLLVDVARGVEYLHDMHVVHGDLKGTNILVKDDGSACLADFGLISITLDLETTDIASTSGGKAEGTYRWMSPELFDPKNFGLPKVTLTKMSDCYALGMVIYEVLSGKDPFEELGPSVVVPCKVLEGTHPGIPKNIDTRMMGLWDLARECWSHRPQDRPSSTTILDRL